MNKEEAAQWREELIQIMMEWRDCDRTEAEIILKRIGARLDGYGHYEVQSMYPLENNE